MDARIRNEIERKVEQYDTTKKRIKKRIKDSVKTAMEKLKAVEKELLYEVETELGENPFSAFLTKVDPDDNPGNPPTEAEIEDILLYEMSEDLGPDEESFNHFYMEIEALREWRKKLVPKNITAKSTTWDSITLTWDTVKGASSYQIEVNGSKSLGKSTTNTFTKGGLLPDTEHAFRVRGMKGNSVSEWSDIVKGRTDKVPFRYSLWKECPDNVYESRKYFVDEENPRVVTNIGSGYDYCTIIGNTPLPLNKVASWSIKILDSKGNNGGCVHVGVAPSDIDQNENYNYNKCGWYFNCYDSTLGSGPPHKYSCKNMDQGKKKDGVNMFTTETVLVL